ncbi:MAG: hypothetical protein OEZ48_00165 [Candidatus Bathyarchaeota archaeon]|nr:hypothetical protein [Candidatus Bathyarchaeota archaeon]
MVKIDITTKQLGIIILILLLIFTPLGVAIKTGAIDIARIFVPAEVIEQIEDVTETEEGEYEGYFGTCQFKLILGDYFTGAAVTPTNQKSILYHEVPAKGTTGTAITASGTTTEVLKSDGGIVWMEIYSGDDYFLMESEFLASKANERVVDSYWEDYDQDGKDEFVVKLDIADVGERGQGLTPTVSLSLPLLDEDVTGITDDDPSTIVGIGTSENVTIVTWKFSGLTAQDGFAIARLYFATNSTRGGDDVRMENLRLTGGWTVAGRTTWAAPIDEDNGNYEAWYVRTDDYLEVHNGVLVYRQTNAGDSLYVELTVRCTMETDDVVNFDIYIDILSAAGAVTTLTDDIDLCA